MTLLVDARPYFVTIVPWLSHGVFFTLRELARIAGYVDAI
jgi:hypothetical protein